MTHREGLASVGIKMDKGVDMLGKVGDCGDEGIE